MEGHNCSQMCIELEGSYNCACDSGYELQEDGLTCEGMYVTALCEQGIDDVPNVA